MRSSPSQTITTRPWGFDEITPLSDIELCSRKFEHAHCDRLDGYGNGKSIVYEVHSWSGLDLDIGLPRK